MHLPLVALGLLTVTAQAEPPRPAEFAWFAEGETCTDHGWSAPVTSNVDYAPCYGGGHLMCGRNDDSPTGAHEARFAVHLDEPGAYLVWIAATRPDVASALRVSVDDAAPVDVLALTATGRWGPSDVFSWMPAARVGLAAGDHSLTVGVSARRPGDNLYYAYLDAVGLQRIGEDAALPFQPALVLPDIDSAKTSVRFYSGNSSVGHFMQYWGTGNPGDDGAIDQRMIDLLKRCGCQAMCDYLAWCRTEPERGAWDWSFYRENARKLHAAGLEYNIFAWLHFPPRWFMDTPEYVPYQCLEHGEELQQLSLWAPATLAIYDGFYRRLAADLGEPVEFIRLAMPSEYGELGYAAGMTHWLVPQKHVHPGFWCGDPCARADFRGKMQERFGTLEALNARWGTGFPAWEEVAPPPDPDAAARRALESRSPTDRRRWLDFVDWYQDAWGDFAVAATDIVKQHFPGREVILSLGYGAESVVVGNDQSRHVRRFAQAGAAAQTPGDIGYFATRRVSSACRAFGVPYYTEPPGDVDRLRQTRRLFYDISNGTQTWFDYPQNMDRSRDLLAAALPYLNGSAPVCDVAYLLPSSWWWCHPRMDWPMRTLTFAETLRDRMDYEVLDELLVREGGLDRLGIRVLILCEGDFMREDTLRALRDWVSRGGVLALMGADRVEDLDGNTELFDALAPAARADGTDPTAVWDAGQAVGEGRVVALSGTDAGATAAQQAMVLELTYRMTNLDAARRDAVLIEEAVDGVVCTLFADHALLFNDTDHTITKALHWRASDFASDTARPSEMDSAVEVPAHTTACVWFAPSPAPATQPDAEP